MSFLVAWTSLGVQLDVLVGSRGLLPARDFAAAVTARGDLSLLEVPTIFRFGASDGALHAGIVVGIVLSALALVGIVPRLAFALSTALYLSYAVVTRSFLSFQWDNLLLECGFLGSLLSVRGRTPWVWFLLRVALFKLYFESGLAKYQSPLGDWKDGSAMAYYYETAPIPTWVAWYAHHLPAGWHAIESRATLVFELGVPFLIFMGRWPRLVAFAVFSGFQLLNIATANYGFFSYLALVLSVTLLAARDLAWLRVHVRAVRKRLLPRRTGKPSPLGSARAWARLLRYRMASRWRLRVRRPPSDETRTLLFLAHLAAAATITAVYLASSLSGASQNFGGPSFDSLAGVAAALEPLRVVNTYHLFGEITRERVEPTFETFDGAKWTEHALHFKPGPVDRPPPFVAPHQPRVDFSLWFYGLGYERGVPGYVRTLIDRLCADPDAVRPLFVDELPAAPRAARVSFYRYHFTTSDERARSGAWWTREEVGSARGMECARAE